eukprot:scaffold34995_cov27-Phaeocystis_antarctica.AAC.1
MPWETKQGEGRQYMLHVAYATGVPPMARGAREGTAEDLRWRGASFFMQATASMGMPRGKASLNTRPPLAQTAPWVSMAPSTMSWHGQAEQPMMLRGRS